MKIRQTKWSGILVTLWLVLVLSVDDGMAQMTDDFDDFLSGNTTAPSAAPTINGTLSPTASNATLEPTMFPTPIPTAGTPTPTIAETFELEQFDVENLSIGIIGISEALTDEEAAAWEEVTAKYQAEFWDDVSNTPITDFAADVTITTFVLPTPSGEGRRAVRSLQEEEEEEEDMITLFFTQFLIYRLVNADPEGRIRAVSLSTFPFEDPGVRAIYVERLKATGVGALVDIINVTRVSSDATAPPTTAPTTAAPKEEDDEFPLSLPAMIGIGVGGLFCLIATMYVLCCRSSGGEYLPSNDLPPQVNIMGQSDEVSTLAPPPLSGRGPTGSIAGYGDQSVATVDYDYSKAYGGGGDAVSSAGGTFGSQPGGLSVFDSRTAGPTGAALGSFSDADSFDAGYRDTAGATKDIVLNIFAPPGKLGVVIDTPDDGAPVVHAVKDTSVIADQINVGDKLIAVDDEDVRSMTAIKVSKLISRKSANPSRKLTIVRTVAQ